MDNSDFTRNGDYTPTRFESQTDAVNLVCGAKTNQNPENSVGVLTTSGDHIEVKITPTSDLGKIVSELAKIRVGGKADLMRGIQTAQLALKHRQNKNQKQRIIAFVASPVNATEKELETLGKNLKKNNVSLDLVSFGEVTDNAPKLEKLIAAVNSNESSNLLEVPVGPKLLSDVLLSSKIINPDGEAAAAGGGGDGFEFGINPNDDPELALALRISMEEERARQQSMQAAEGGAPAEGAAPAGDSATAPAAAAPAPAAPAADSAPAAAPMATDQAVLEAMGMEDMDEELRQALLLSMQVAGPEPTPAPTSASAPAAAPEAPPKPPAEEKKEEPEAKEAAPAAGAAAPASSSAEDKPEEPDPLATTVDSKWLQDPDFMQELIGQLPGVDINDPRIQAALAEVATPGEQPAGSGEKPKDKDDKDELS